MTLLTLLAGAGVARAQDTVRLPGHLSETSIAAGRDLFHGRAACSGCHGENGVGTPEGPALNTGRWQLGDGSYEWLVHLTQHAGWGTRSRGGDPRPMRGPTGLDSAEVHQVAGYVWFISRQKPPAKTGD